MTNTANTARKVATVAKGNTITRAKRAALKADASKVEAIKIAASQDKAIDDHTRAIADKVESIRKASLADIRNAYAAAQGSAREANMAYAAKLNEVLPGGWYNLLGDIPQRRDGITDKAELAIFDERAAHHTTVRARLGNGANPSPNWKRVATYASEYANGNRDVLGNLIRKADKAKGAGEGGAQGNVNPARSPALRNIEELLKLYKANGKVEGDKKLALANGYIAQALMALGCDVRLQK